MIQEKWQNGADPNVISKLMMLAFLTPSDINEQFNLIEAGAIEMAQPILNYFRKMLCTVFF